MKKFYCCILISIFIAQNILAQEVRFRTTNDVVFGMYTPWNEEKLNTKIPSHLLHKDIELFVKNIEDLGVNPYINISKDSFYNEINLLKGKINEPLTRRQFLQLVVPVMNILRLSHTYFSKVIADSYFNDGKYYNEKGGTYLPIDVRVENNRLIVYKNYSFINNLEGDEIISINSIDSKVILDSLLRYSVNATEYSRLMDVQENFTMLLWWVYNFSGTYKIQTKNAIYLIKGLTSFELNKLKSQNIVMQPENEYKQYEYTQIDSSTCKLTFRDFGIIDTASYNHFLDSAFIQLKANSIQNLIIDVRGNGGGGDQYGVEIVKYIYDKPFKAYSNSFNKKSKISEEFYLLFLYPEDRNDSIMRKAVNWNGPCEAEHNYGDYYECGVEINYPKPESIRFKGKIFVLSDYKVASAGAVFVGLIKDYKIGQIIGTETDQSPSNDGQGCYFLVPNSNILSRGATTYAIRPNGDPSTTRGVVPDYEILQLNSYTEKGVDTIMDFTMRLIKSKN